MPNYRRAQELHESQCGFNPFTASACKIFGLKDARMRLQTVYFWSYNTSTSNATRFDENPFSCQCEKENKKGLSVSDLALLLVVFKSHHGTKGVNSPYGICRRKATFEEEEWKTVTYLR